MELFEDWECEIGRVPHDSVQRRCSDILCRSKYCIVDPDPFNTARRVDFDQILTLKPRDNITMMVGPDFLWRNAKAEGVYLGPSGSFAPYASSRAIGTDLNLDASWQFSKRMQFRLFETYFAASDSFQAHGGYNGNYFGLLGSYRF